MSFNPLNYPLSFDKPRRLTDISSWHQHIPFAFTIVQMLKPKIFVELGTHKGDSYCAFCQAVDVLGLDTACYAIDTWEGDEHSGFYSNEVLEELRAYHDPLYGRFSRLIQSRFDQALNHFSDGSIDLLHIDGLHSYEAVKHDFEMWIPKMSACGVILLHDINVHERDFGVWNLWEELKEKYPYFEFKHGHGLGVLAVGVKVSEQIMNLLNIDEQEVDTISLFFSCLGDKITLAEGISKIQSVSIELNSAIQAKDVHIKNLDASLHEKNVRVVEFTSMVQAKDAQIKNLEESLYKKNAQVDEFTITLQAKDAQIKNLEESLYKKNVQVGEFEGTLQARDTQINELNSTLQSKESQIDLLNKAIHDKDVHIRNITAILNSKYESKGWKFIQLIPNLKIKLSNLIKLGRASCRILINKGPRSFIKRAIWHFKYSKKITELYDIYIEKNKITTSDIKKMKNELKTFKYKPKISLIMPVYNVDKIWLDKAINSVINQVYENWELCLVDDASTKIHIQKVLENYQKQNNRIKVKYLKENQGISGASNEAISLATGEFIGLLDNDDELTVNALFEVIKLLQEHPDGDMIYSDEDKIDVNGKRSEPYFKPDWSPDLFLSNMYTCHFGVYRKKIIDEIGGFRKGYEGSQDYDLVLRFTEISDKIYHIPKILYHWRKIPNSTADRYEAKGYADINARKALEDSLKRRKINGEVLSGNFPTSFRIKREIIGTPRVSIIIPTKDHIDVLKKSIDSIEKKTSYKNYEIIIIDNNSEENQTLDYLEKISKAPNIRTLRYENSFNFSSINNFAVRNSKSEYLLFLNNDTEIISHEWLSAMLEHAQRKEVGAVGCKLLYPNDTIQHAGVILGITGTPGKLGVAGHSHKHLPNVAPGYFGKPHIIQNLSAITAACVMIRRDVFDEIGGFDENLAVAFNDVDLGLKIRGKGYLIVYTPYAELYHHESLSRGYEDNPEKQKRFLKEVKYTREKWGHIIDKGDPYYNHNLSLEHEDFRIKN